MARLARVVFPGGAHHVIHRGNRRQKVFFCENDKQKYLDILHLQSTLYGVRVWAYCLMDNHVHLIVVPSEESSLAAAIGETHKSYTRMINFREGWRGSLWEGRFKSMLMDESYLYMAVRYVERNPVRAGIVKRAQDYRWSSAAFRVKKMENKVLSDFYLTQEIKDWASYLRAADPEPQLARFRIQSLSGRPLGDKSFLKGLENKLGRGLLKRKPGPTR